MALVAVGIEEKVAIHLVAGNKVKICSGTSTVKLDYMSHFVTT
jgi:hypothetical protein